MPLFYAVPNNRWTTYADGCMGSRFRMRRARVDTSGECQHAIAALSALDWTGIGNDTRGSVSDGAGRFVDAMGECYASGLWGCGRIRSHGVDPIGDCGDRWNGISDRGGDRLACGMGVRCAG